MLFCGISLLLTAAMVFCFPKSGSTMSGESDIVPATVPDVPLQEDLLEVEPAATPISEVVEVSPEDEAEAWFRSLVQEAVGCVESQKQVDESLLQELDSEIYTF